MASSLPALDLSIVLITFNEERNLTDFFSKISKDFLNRCEVVILDSNSTDKTKEIAESNGAIVRVKAFENYASQKNAAIELASRTWILSLDADEIPSTQLLAEIAELVQSNQKVDGVFKVKRRLVFLGKVMRFGKTYDAPVRFFRKGTGSFQNSIHEEYVFEKPSRPLRALSNEMYHYSYRSISEYFDRFNIYTTKIAAQHKSKATPLPSRFAIAIRVPFEFFSRYILRLGFLDGYPGFVWALFGTFYGFVKYAKYIESEKS